MGAVTVSNVRRLGNVLTHINGFAVKCRITLSNSYATGGDSLALPSTHGLRRVDAMMVLSGTKKIRGSDITAAVLGGVPVLAGTPTAPLILMTGGGGTPGQVANATDLSGQAFDVILIGRTVA